MAVLDITHYELVPAPEFPGTGRYISELQEMEYRRFHSAFLTLLILIVYAGAAVYHGITIFSNINSKHMQHEQKSYLNIDTKYYLLALQKKSDYFCTRV